MYTVYQFTSGQSSPVHRRQNIVNSRFSILYSPSVPFMIARTGRKHSNLRWMVTRTLRIVKRLITDMSVLLQSQPILTSYVVSLVGSTLVVISLVGVVISLVGVVISLVGVVISLVGVIISLVGTS